MAKDEVLAAKEEELEENEEFETSEDSGASEQSEEKASKPAKKEKDKKSDSKPAKAKDKKNKPGFFKRFARFFKDLKSELKKVVWPTRKSVVNNTIVVIVTMIIAGLVVWGLDTILTLLIKLLLKQV